MTDLSDLELSEDESENGDCSGAEDAVSGAKDEIGKAAAASKSRHDDAMEIDPTPKQLDNTETPLIIPPDSSQSDTSRENSEGNPNSPSAISVVEEIVISNDETFVLPHVASVQGGLSGRRSCGKSSGERGRPVAQSSSVPLDIITIDDDEPNGPRSDGSNPAPKGGGRSGTPLQISAKKKSAASKESVVGGSSSARKSLATESSKTADGLPVGIDRGVSVTPVTKKRPAAKAAAKSTGAANNGRTTRMSLRSEAKGTKREASSEEDTDERPVTPARQGFAKRKQRRIESSSEEEDPPSQVSTRTPRRTARNSARRSMDESSDEDSPDRSFTPCGNRRSGRSVSKTPGRTKAKVANEGKSSVKKNSKRAKTTSISPEQSIAGESHDAEAFNESEPEYDVEELVSLQKEFVTHGRWQFEVKWKDYPSSANTFEYLDKLYNSQAAIKQFLEDDPEWNLYLSVDQVNKKLTLKDKKYLPKKDTALERAVSAMSTRVLPGIDFEASSSASNNITKKAKKAQSCPRGATRGATPPESGGSPKSNVKSAVPTSSVENDPASATLPPKESPASHESPRRTPRNEAPTSSAAPSNESRNVESLAPRKSPRKAAGSSRPTSPSGSGNVRRSPRKGLSRSGTASASASSAKFQSRGKMLSRLHEKLSDDDSAASEEEDSGQPTNQSACVPKPVSKRFEKPNGSTAGPRVRYNPKPPSANAPGNSVSSSSPEASTSGNKNTVSPRGSKRPGEDSSPQGQRLAWQKRMKAAEVKLEDDNAAAPEGAAQTVEVPVADSVAASAAVVAPSTVNLEQNTPSEITSSPPVSASQESTEGGVTGLPSNLDSPGVDEGMLSSTEPADVPITATGNSPARVDTLANELTDVAPGASGTEVSVAFNDVPVNDQYVPDAHEEAAEPPSNEEFVADLFDIPSPQQFGDTSTAAHTAGPAGTPPSTPSMPQAASAPAAPNPDVGQAVQTTSSLTASQAADSTTGTSSASLDKPPLPVMKIKIWKTDTHVFYKVPRGLDDELMDDALECDDSDEDDDPSYGYYEIVGHYVKPGKKPQNGRDFRTWKFNVVLVRDGVETPLPGALSFQLCAGLCRGALSAYFEKLKQDIELKSATVKGKIEKKQDEKGMFHKVVALQARMCRDPLGFELTQKVIRGELSISDETFVALMESFENQEDDAQAELAD